MTPTGIVITRSFMETIECAGETAYPEESCGLLVGRLDDAGRAVVTRVCPSPTVAEGDRRVMFEVDPATRFAAMRALEEPDERIVGHYHSHPDHGPEPSARDLAMAFEPEFIWLITEVAIGRARGSRAFAVAADGSGFTPVAIFR